MSLTDTLGSLAVASQGQYMTGVSTDISTSFVKPAGKPGDELKITATLTAMGTCRSSSLFSFRVFLLVAVYLAPLAVNLFSFLLFFYREVAGVYPGRLYQSGGAVGRLREWVSFPRAIIVFSVALLTKEFVGDQHIRSTLASQLGMRCAIFI
jgi:hypothetical protein